MVTRYDWTKNVGGTVVDTTPKKEINKAKVVIEEEVYKKIMYWIKKAPGEISGLGKIQFIEGAFRVTSVILLEQENTGASTEMTSDSINKAMFRLKDEPGHLNFWWHSHVNMSTFWSGTDEDTIAEIGSNGWVLATVLNKSGETRSAYYAVATETTPSLFIDDIDTAYLVSEEEIPTEWTQEYTENVKEKTYESPTVYGRSVESSNYWKDKYPTSNWRSGHEEGSRWGKGKDGISRWITTEEQENKDKDGDYGTTKEGTFGWIAKDGSTKTPTKKELENMEEWLDKQEELRDEAEDAEADLKEEMSIMGLSKSYDSK